MHSRIFSRGLLFEFFKGVSNKDGASIGARTVSYPVNIPEICSTVDDLFSDKVRRPEKYH